MENKIIWKTGTSEKRNLGTSENRNDDDKQDHLERKEI